tara:strand:+ start:15189 stop:16283 length:1095 start_codon:yes stop_codon:yes gene_type:complete
MSVLNPAKNLLPLNLKFNSINPVVVIHSDDWGSIRMPSNKVRQALQRQNGISAESPYALYDSLATKKDLERLFETLSANRDANNRPAIITANVIMANPDFEKIKASNFKEYHYKGLDDTFSEYNNSEALEYWKYGMEERVFQPQYHGREHVNVPYWLQKLQEGHKGVRAAFEAKVFGVDYTDLKLRKTNFQAAWDFDSQDQESYLLESIKEGYQAFTEYFGFKSLTAIAPSYTWSLAMEKMLRNEGVRSMQSIIMHKVPNGRSDVYRRKRHLVYTKKYQVRMSFFEPSLMVPDFDNVGFAMERIRHQISKGKPAFVSSHRLNFVGTLDESNRERNLTQLAKLLAAIRKEYPNVLFKSADELLQS